MSRRIRNPPAQQDPRTIAKFMIEQISSYGPGAREEVVEIHKRHDPASIFKMKEGPEKATATGAYISELRELLASLTRDRQVSGLRASKRKSKDRAREEALEAKSQRRKKAAERRKKAQAAMSGKPKKTDKIEVTYPGNYQGFRYEVYLLTNGKYLPRVTSKARKLMPFEDKRFGQAPQIKDNKRLAKLYKDQESAEIAARRAINETLMWYDERGLTPIERKRKTKGVKGAIRRRSAGQVASRQEEMTEAQKAAERKRIKAERERRKAERKVSRATQERRREAEGKTRGGQQLALGRVMYMPKSNPSSFEFFSDSQSTTPKSQASLSFKQYKEDLKRFKRSLRDNDPDFGLLLRAYDMIENARANAYMAGNTGRASKYDEHRGDLREMIEDSLEACSELIVKSGGSYIDNPGPREHGAIGLGYLDKAERGWDKYSRTSNMTTLMNVYKNAELACEELSYAKDKKNLHRAKKVCSLARNEMKGLMGK